MSKNMQEYKKMLDALSATVLRAYLDSVMFVYIIEFANDKRRPNNFLFDYSYYSIREKAIIAAKNLIEPQGNNRLTIEKVIKYLQHNEQHKQYGDEIYLRYRELFDSEGAKRVKFFRDSLCHNIENEPKIMIYGKDILIIINDVMKILNDIYLYVFKTKNENFCKIQNISMLLADDYWGAICNQADKMPNRSNELMELQKLFDC